MVVQLSPDQFKRLRSELVRLGFASSLAKARKLTSSPDRCRELAVRVFSTYGVPDTLADVSALYVVPEKPEPVEIEPGSGLPKRTRGKGVKPSKVMYRLRLDQVQVDGLKALGGNSSAHIRAAIDEYLKKGGGGSA